MCLNAVLLSKSLMEDAHSLISASLLQGSWTTGYLSPHHGSSPSMSSVCPKEGKHRIKLRESVFLGKKEKTRLPFSSKLNFPVMDLRKGWRHGFAGKQDGGPWRPDVQPASWRHGRPRVPQGSSPPNTRCRADASTPSPSPMLLWRHAGRRTAGAAPTRLWGCRLLLAGSRVPRPSSLTY